MLNLTPASISFFTQFILALVISVFLLLRLRKFRSRQLALLTAFFSLVTLYIVLLFLDVSLAPYPRLVFAVYIENTLLALTLVFLIQFAYHFPQRYPQHRLEAAISLILSLGYFLWETGYMIFRYVMLLGHETVFYRPHFAAFLMAIIMAIAPLAFVRQCIAADPRQVNWLRKLWKPEGKEARGARTYVGVFGIILYLGITNVLLISGLPHTIYYTSLSIGILIAIWLFASNYINFIPRGVSVQIKFLVLTLTIFLAILGSAGWFIAPAYIATFQPNLSDHQTLRFTPNNAGSYDVTEIKFSFEEDIGDKLTVPHAFEVNSFEIDFTFPFFGQEYKKIYVSSYGVITLGEHFWEPNLQARGATFPAIMPLVMDLNPKPQDAQDSGLFAHFDNNAGQLIITWNQLPSYYYPESIFTFQVILYQDGVFDITYNGLPLPIIYNQDDSPRANPWMRGIVSGQGESLHSNTTGLLVTAQTGEGPLVENFHLTFRQYLHIFMLPLLGIVIGGCILLMVGLPLVLRFSILEPLSALRDGVQRMESGDLKVDLPIHHEDEIGYLTGAFNTLAARLDDLITGLEKRVAERTSALAIANQRLQEQLTTTENLRAKLQEQAIRDPLTNAFNRRYLMETLEREMPRAKRHQYPLSVLMIDVDHFKQFNDTFGHQIGDRALQYLVKLTLENTRKGDVVCRYGGEEFVVLMPNISAKDAFQRAEELRRKCEASKCDDKEVTSRITLSIGVATLADPEMTGEQLLSMADQAMYQAKAAGRNRTVIYQ